MRTDVQENQNSNVLTYLCVSELRQEPGGSFNCFDEGETKIVKVKVTATATATATAMAGLDNNAMD